MDTRNVRAAIRFIGFVLSTVLLMLLIGLGQLSGLIQKDWKTRWKNSLISAWARFIRRLIGLTIEVKGQPPRAPFFLVSNHLSYIDILPFWIHTKATFIAKSEISRWPFIGWAARLLGMIFIDRDRTKDIRRVNKLIGKNINNHQGVILFPEGTSTKGAGVLPFNSSLFLFPAVENIPVHYATLQYRVDSPNPKYNAWQDVCWWGNMEFMSHFWNLLKIKSYTVSVHFGDEPVRDSDRKRLAKNLHKKVEKCFVPTFNPTS